MPRACIRPSTIDSFALTSPRAGVFQQWVQTHHLDPRAFATIVNTLRREFAHVALFYGGDQGMLVATDAALAWSHERCERLSALPGFRDTLPNGRSLEDLLADLVAFDAGLDRYLDDAAHGAHVPRDDLVSTDDNLYLEYATPRGNVLPWEAGEALLAALRTYRDPAAIAGLEADGPRPVPR